MIGVIFTSQIKPHLNDIGAANFKSNFWNKVHNIEYLIKTYHHIKISRSPSIAIRMYSSFKILVSMLPYLTSQSMSLYILLVFLSSRTLQIFYLKSQKIQVVSVCTFNENYSCSSKIINLVSRQIKNLVGYRWIDLLKTY